MRRKRIKYSSDLLEFSPSALSKTTGVPLPVAGRMRAKAQAEFNQWQTTSLGGAVWLIAMPLAWVGRQVRREWQQRWCSQHRPRVHAARAVARVQPLLTMCDAVGAAQQQQPAAVQPAAEG